LIVAPVQVKAEAPVAGAQAKGAVQVTLDTPLLLAAP
jgi:hypothetical protein